jgi:TetR/AcrR family transcriptional regulator, transcriptional repressor for nem operon
LINIPTGWYVQNVPRTNAPIDARAKLLNVALAVIRTKGYSATSVDELCGAAGVTKGAFFYHFETKNDLAVAAANHWSETTASLFVDAPYHSHPDALSRLLAYVTYRKELLQGRVPEFTCLVGTMLQEVYETAPAIRDACQSCIQKHAETLEAEIETAICECGMTPEWSAKSLALHTQAVIQGAFILAKGTGSAEIAADTIDHLHRYIELLFGRHERPIKPQLNLPQRKRPYALNR